MTETRTIWWICTIFQLAGVFILASNTVPASYCYILLLLGSSAGLVGSWYDRNTPLVFLNLGFTVANSIGIVRWS
jgi:hypothetical protein